jgi:hypothetical protein
MKKISEIERELKKNGLTPIATTYLGEDDGTAVRIQGKRKNISKVFKPRNVWGEPNEKTYTDKEEWYTTIKNNDPRLPEIKRITVNRMIRETSRRNKKKGEILKGLTKKMDMEIRETFESTFEVIIRPAINNHDLYFYDKNIKLALHKKAVTININKPVNKIIDEITFNLKKDLIESSLETKI